ncbi:hypothetical protein [Streptomyces sp. NPDC052496]|uniref:hypothetical protein n=1 Tax=Streptomyces sp. NPDC052496 TaxID=3154951 RepID=UPI00341F7840
MAKNRGNDGIDIAALAQTRIESIDAPTHLGTGEQINGAQSNGDTTVINGDHADIHISHTFDR